MTHFLITSLGADSRVTAVFQSLPEFKWFSSRHLCTSHVPLNPHLNRSHKHPVSWKPSDYQPHWFMFYPIIATQEEKCLQRVPAHFAHEGHRELSITELTQINWHFIHFKQDSDGVNKAWQPGSVSPLTLPGWMRALSARHQTPQTFAI